MSDLCFLMYASAARGGLDPRAIDRILEVSRRNNATYGITGVLLMVDLHFLQVLEGPPDAVRTTFAKIAQDPRHGSVLKLMERPVGHRCFGDWEMGWERLTIDRAVPNKPDGIFDLTYGALLSKAAAALPPEVNVFLRNFISIDKHNAVA